MTEKSYIDIGRWWLKDGLGKPMSVNAIFESIQGTENEIGRYSLAKARDGKLEKADIKTIDALIRLCSIWAGKDLTFEDLKPSSKDKVNFNMPIAA